MCTVTIVPCDDGFRVRFNRDERRDRPAAAPPIVQTIEGRRAIFPVDPRSQGTWIGVNDVGLAMALLNRTIGASATLDQTPRVSRGCIIPRLLGGRSLDDVLDRCSALDLGRFDQFRLLIVQNTTAVVVTSDARVLSHDRVSLARPIMLTSSSLGDDVVEPPRRQLFDQLFDQHPRTWLRVQRHFHGHQWPARTEISVMMERSDAKTVSQTVIDVRESAIRMAYREVGSAPRGFSRKIERCPRG
jgi:hypothetical protein